MSGTADVALSRQDKEPWGPTLHLSEGPRGDHARVLARHSNSGYIWNFIPAAHSADPSPPRIPSSNFPRLYSFPLEFNM